MSEPKRLREGGGPAGMLLGSAHDDAPSAESFERAAKRLGLVGAVLGASTLGASSAAASATTASAASGTGATVGTVATSAGIGATVGTVATGAGIGATTSALTGAGTTAASVAGVSLFTKLVAVTVVGVALATGTVIATREGPSTALEAPPPHTEQASQTQGTPADRAHPIAPVITPPPIEAPARVAEPVAIVDTKDSPKPEKTSTKPSSSSDTTLRDEVALLDAARAANARGDTAQALAVLAQHAQRFPQGFLRSEAAVLRVEALMKAGRRAEGRAEGERLLAREPNGPQAQRVRSLLEP